jgi:hypothetical protein
MNFEACIRKTAYQFKTYTVYLQKKGGLDPTDNKIGLNLQLLNIIKKLEKKQAALC